MGNTVSVVGKWMHHIALGWLALELTDSALYVGLVQALATLPILLFTLGAGVLADRVSKRRLMLAMQLIAMVIAALMGVMVLMEQATIGRIMFFAFALGTTNAFEIPTRHAFVFELVGKDDVTNAVALNSTSWNAARIAGPALGGVLISVVGTGVCFLINSATFVVSISSLLLIGSAEKPITPHTRSAWSEFTMGIRFMVGDRRIFPLVQLVAVLSLVGMPVEVLLPVLVRQDLGMGATAYGGLVAALGSGALIGALALATFARLLARGRLVRTTSMLFGSALVMLSLANGVSLVAGVLVIIGVTLILTTSTTNTLLQSLAPDEYRGRVMSAYTFAFLGLSPFGSTGAGIAAQWLGVRPAMAVGGAIIVLFSVLVVSRQRELIATR